MAVFFQQRNKRTIYTLTFFLSVLLLLHLAVANETLRYDMTAIADGEIWRLVTSALTHLNIVHLLQNAVALLLLALLYPAQFAQTRWIVELLLLAFLGNCITMIAHADSVIQSGLSGALHGLMFGFAVRSWRLIRSKVLLVLLAGKIITEQLTDFSLRDFGYSLPIYADGHLFGVIAAIWLRFVVMRLGKVNST